MSQSAASSKLSRDPKHRSNTGAVSNDPNSPGDEPSKNPSSLACLSQASLCAYPSPSHSGLASQDGRASESGAQMDPSCCSGDRRDSSPSRIFEAAGGLQRHCIDAACSPSPILLAQGNPLPSPVAPELHSCGRVPGLPPALTSPQLSQQVLADADASSLQGVTSTGLHEQKPTKQHACPSKGKPVTSVQCGQVGSGQSSHLTSDKPGAVTRKGIDHLRKGQQQSDVSGPSASFSMSSGQRSNPPSDSSDTASKALTLRPRHRQPAARPVHHEKA